MGLIQTVVQYQEFAAPIAAAQAAASSWRIEAAMASHTNLTEQMVIEGAAALSTADAISQLQEETTASMHVHPGRADELYAEVDAQADALGDLDDELLSTMQDFAPGLGFDMTEDGAQLIAQQKQILNKVNAQ